MTLSEIRTRFIELSGRRDLSAGAADWYIQAGQRLLDRLPYDGKHQEAKWRFTLTAGTVEVKSSAIRAVKDVRVETTDATYYLVRMKLGELREYFGAPDGFSSVTAGNPLYYAPYSTRSITSITEADESSKGLFILPPPDVSYTVEVRGLFASAPLVANSDISFWTLMHPETLIQAAWYSLERFYRNKQGMEDHMTAITQDLQGLDFDVVEEDIAGMDVMQDSWRF